jgi:hypothetical protein
MDDLTMSAEEWVEVQIALDRRECRRLVDSMTNWQRNKWARAGYPGGTSIPAKILPFVQRKRGSLS